MSYHNWSTDGYGVDITDLKPDKGRLLDFIASAPGLKDDIEGEAGMTLDEMRKNDAIDCEDIYDYGSDSNARCTDLGDLIAYAAAEIDDILLTAVENENGDRRYVLFENRLPWDYSARERSMSESDIDGIFMRYMDILADDPKNFRPMDLSVENGG